MWAKFPADFTIWLKSVFAWGDTVVSDSYFTHWAGALVNTNTSSVCLLPACVILLLVPELLKVLINIVLFLSLLFLLSWLGIGLFGSWVVIVMMIIVSLVVWVMERVMDIMVISDSVLIVMVMMFIVVEVMVEVVVFWVFTIDEMWLSVFGLIGFMDGLWVNMMVVVVEESMFSVVETVVVIMMVVMVIVMVIVMEVVVCAIMSIYEWVVVDGLVVMMIVMVSMMVSMVVIMPISVVVVMMVGMVCLFMTVVISVDGAIFFMVIVVDIVAISMVSVSISVDTVVTMVTMAKSVSESMISMSVVTPVSSPFTVVSMSISMIFMSKSMVSMVSPCGLMVSTNPPISVVWSFVVWSFMVWSLVVRSVEVGILMMALVWENVTNCNIISIMMGVPFSHVVSPVSLGVLHFLSVSTNVVVVMWVWELMWEDLKGSLSVVLGIDNTDVSSIMVIIVVAKVVWVVLIMDVVVIVVSIDMSLESVTKFMVVISMVAIVTILEMWLFVKSVLNVVAIISESSVFTMHVVALMAEVVTETMVSDEQWVRLASLSELLGVLDLGAICSLVLMWAHISVSLWENTLIRVTIVMVFSTGVVSLVGGLNVVRSSIMVIGWVSGVVSISVVQLVMRSSVVWGGMNIVV